MLDADEVTVLHVDDDAQLAELTAECLEDEADRFTVETATSASAGLDRLATTTYDCVVSDYEMPGTDGIEFLEAVRENEPELPFILFTGKGSEAVAADAISAGVTDYLQKETGLDQYTLLANRIENAVSARRSAAEAERSRDRLEQILKTVPSCVVELDDDGNFVFANDRAVEVLGLKKGALTDRTYNDPEWRIADLNGEPIPDEKLPFRRVRDTGEPLYGFRHQIAWPDGTRKVLSVSGAPLFDDGDVDGAVFSLSDVTEQWDSDASVERTAARIEPLFEKAPDMINIHDTDGNIIDPNPRLCEELGYDEAELTGMKVWDMDTRLGPGEARDMWTQMSAGDQVRLESTYRRRDGSEVPVEVHIRRFEVNGTARFAASSRVIVDRVERRQELQRQNERLERFAGVVSHDLRNPLNVAAGHTELAREECDSDHLDKVAESHERMEDLIEDLLALARDGQDVETTQPVALASTVEECWETVDPADATLVVEADRTVDADPNRLQQLLDNLLSNAVEHGGEDVTVTVGALEGGFYVADDGPGIPPENRDRVFESGYSTVDDGTGFGLNIVREIAEAHGWTVTATDSETGGTRFEITGVARPGE